jgi:alpha-beta hydrolase superfamily lysophospholipase
MSAQATSSQSTSIQGILQPRGFPGLPVGWSYETETYPSVDGLAQIFSISFFKARPEAGQGHRALLISHGIGEHGGRYMHFPHYLQHSIDLVVAPDHRGHGRSDGLRGHVEKFTDYEDDLALAIRRLDEKLRKRYGKSEIHVMGHSLGSLVLLGALSRYHDLPIASATVSSPLISLRMAVPFAKKYAAHAISRIWGKLQMGSELNVNDISHDREVIEAYQKDRLVHDRITPKLFLGMQASMAAIAKKDNPFPYPLLAVVPMDDPIVNPEVSLNFYKALKISDKQLKTYPGFFHESFNELGKERVFEDLEAWIKQHSQTN